MARAHRARRRNLYLDDESLAQGRGGGPRGLPLLPEPDEPGHRRCQRERQPQRHRGNLQREEERGGPDAASGAGSEAILGSDQGRKILEAFVANRSPPRFGLPAVFPSPELARIPEVAAARPALGSSLMNTPFRDPDVSSSFREAPPQAHTRRAAVASFLALPFAAGAAAPPRPGGGTAEGARRSGVTGSAATARRS